MQYNIMIITAEIVLIDGLKPSNVVVRVRYEMHVEIAIFDRMTRLKRKR